MEQDIYSEIAPYSDELIPQAMEKIANDSKLENISRYLYPEKPAEFLKNIVKSCRTTFDFQKNIMFQAVNQVLAKTASKLTFSGIENFKPGNKYLIVSNHRDIVLDSAIIQKILFQNNIPTTEIAVGDNLISSPFIDDFCRSNKMIKVIRKNISPRELYSASKLLSGYIRQQVSNRISSIWIAQRNGRTKDGNDLTEQGLLKMFDMSGTSDFVKDFSALHIMPTSISYEYESCDFFKTAETYIKRRMKYVKAENEDFISILTGITQNKGDINVTFNEPVTLEEIQESARMDKNERFRHLADIMDSKIISNYLFHKTNYIAYDIVNKTTKYAKKYTQADKEKFLEYMRKGLDALNMPARLAALSDAQGKAVEYVRSEMEDIFLKIYSNPVLSKEQRTVAIA